ncbi:phage head-binding domain-containing protein [Serratia fonticola]|uniref:phage head-binding domain-containing protein n=1 Tax=Serratia fonticola TaxID=47917 RepID=UPI0034C5BC23
MADTIIPNVVVSMPAQLFTQPRAFKGNAGGKIYIGKIDTDPTIPENQIQVYLQNEDGTTVPMAQPIVINSGGYPVYNGQIAKFVTVEGHSMAIYDSLGVQQFYFPNVLKYDPDMFGQRLTADMLSPEGFKLIPSLQPRPVAASSIFADRNAGVLPTNTSAVNGSIVNGLLSQYDEVILVEGVPLGGIVVSARKVLRSMNRVRMTMDSTVAFGLKVERGSVGSNFFNLVFKCDANNQTAFIQDGQSGNVALAYPQYSNYYSCDAEGDHVNGSASVFLSYTWSNKWFGCNFNRTVNGVIFGRDTDPDGFVNANHFYGCELRSDKTQPNSGSPIIHNSGTGNTFIGGAIENWFGSPTVKAGHLIITGGCYLEAMDTTYHVSGGRLVMDGCHDNGPAIVIDADGSSLVYTNTQFTGSEGVYTNNYPKIQRRGDLDAEIVISGVKSGRDSSVLIRPGEWRTNGGVWSKTTPRKSRESIDYGYSSMSARVGDDQLNVTGLDNAYTVRFNNTTIDADSGNEFNATVGIFTAGVGGMRTISAGVYLGGAVSGQLCELFAVTTDRKYLLATRRGDGIANILLAGTVSTPLLNGQTVRLQVVAHSGSTNNVSVLRGDAVNGYSYLSIVR